MQENTNIFTLSKKVKLYLGICFTIGFLGILFGFISDNTERVFANLLVNAYYITCLSFAGVMFVAIQYVANATWSASLLKVPNAFNASIPVTAFILFSVITIGLYTHNLYHHWSAEGLTDVLSPNYDHTIAKKSAWLNKPFFIIRIFLYLFIWGLIGYFIKIQDNVLDIEKAHKQRIKFSAIFCVVFGFTFPLFAFDAMMSIEAHWFSTMFGWWNLAGLWVSGIAAITLTIILLKENNYMPWINVSHIHDLGKLMFAFSIFWTYTWLGQFLLIWYANIPEEVSYFLNRFQSNYIVLFWLNIVINFVIPFFVLMTSDNKRNIKIVKIIAIVIILGHWLDYFLMVMPGTLSEFSGFNIIDLSGILFLGSIFIYTMLHNLSKQNLLQNNNPYMEDSFNHKIPNI